MSKKQQLIGAQPTGPKGVFAGKIMNLIHSSLYKMVIRTYIIGRLDLTFGNTVLDIGCGGGKAVRLLFEMLGNSMICGIDHSEDMVELSSEVNKKGISRGIVEIKQAKVSNIPYPDGYFNIITAFNNINSWDNYPKCFTEINRVLNDNGVLLIINDFPKEGTRRHTAAVFKDEDDYTGGLRKHNFRDVTAEITRNTIIICCRGAVLQR